MQQNTTFLTEKKPRSLTAQPENRLAEHTSSNENAHEARTAQPVVRFGAGKSFSQQSVERVGVCVWVCVPGACAEPA